jgi:hypothetical protein
MLGAIGGAVLDLSAVYAPVRRISSLKFTTTLFEDIFFSLRDRLLNEVIRTANGKIQKEQEQSEAQSDGA